MDASPHLPPTVTTPPAPRGRSAPSVPRRAGRLALLAGLVGLAAGAALTTPATAGPAPTGPAARPGTPATAGSAARPVLSGVAVPMVRPAGVASPAVRPAPGLLPAGYGPTDLRDLYSLPTNGGAGQTVAIVVAYDDPTAAADLAVYRSTFGLAPLASGQFRKVNQDGQAAPLPAADAGWATESSLDLDMVSAIAPGADILLVEATGASETDLLAGIAPAIDLGARYVTMSWGAAESSDDVAAAQQYLNRPGVAFTAPVSTDSGQQFPSTAPFVTAVGATSVSPVVGGKGWTEAAIGGGGCSVYQPRQPWQQAVATGCASRAVADVAAVGDPATGVAAYDTYQSSGWNVYGGTSVSSSIIIGVYALAGPPGATDYPVSYPYAHPAALHDIIQGPGAAAGWDPPTGLGSPKGIAAFAP